MSESVVNLFAFWSDNYVDIATCLCSLCGNRGIIDTRATAISHAGVKSGKEQFCICPNGLTMREQVEFAIKAAITKKAGGGVI